MNDPRQDPKKSTKNPEAGAEPAHSERREGGPIEQPRDVGQGVPAHPYQLPKAEAEINIEKGERDARSIHGD